MLNVAALFLFILKPLYRFMGENDLRLSLLMHNMYNYGNKSKGG